MVGGLVQDQEVDFLVHEHAQPQTAELAAGQDRHAFEHVLPLELVGSQAVAGGLGCYIALFVQHRVQKGTLRVVEVNDLGQIRRPDGGTHADDAAAYRLGPGDHVQQGGFAGAVFAEKGDALAALHPQVHIGKESAVTEGLGHALQLKHLVAAKLPAGEASVHLLGLGGLGHGAHALDALFHGKGPLVQGVVAHKGPQVHLLRRLFQLLDLGLLLEVLLHALLVAALLFNGIKAVVAAVKLRLAVQDLDDAGDGAVQEIAVVGDGDHGAPEGADILLQPLGGLKVQVVGGLIQQENVRILQDQAAQVHPGLFAAGQLVKQSPPHIAVDGQAVGHLVDGCVGVVAPQSLEPGGELPIAAQGMGVAVPLLHPAGQSVHLLLQGGGPLKGGAQNILHGVSCGIHRDLRNQAHPAARGDEHLAGVIIQVSGEDVE